MRRIFFVILIVFLFYPPISFGQSPKISSEESADKINVKVNELKNKVASRVAELKLVEKRGIVGTVEEVSDTQITINDINNNRRIIDIDEFTKFSSSETNSFGISDIKKGSKISVLGLYNKNSRRILGRFINEFPIPLFITGVVLKKDEDEFTISLRAEDETEYVVDVERITKTFVYNDGELETGGFTKIKISENAIVIGFPDDKEKNRITAGRIILLPDVPSNPKIPFNEKIPTSSPTPSPTPTPK